MFLRASESSDSILLSAQQLIYVTISINKLFAYVARGLLEKFYDIKAVYGVAFYNKQYFFKPWKVRRGLIPPKMPNLNQKNPTKNI